MSKAISYSLFGYGRERAENCLDFASYLRGLMLCLRYNRLLYPEWTTILETDNSTYNAYEPLFKMLTDKNILRIEKNPDNTPLCEAMLWRLKPVYWKDIYHQWEFTHVLCRDLDSPATYREAQAVQMWINHDKTMHAITDSVSHDVALLGGMIGIKPKYFSERTATDNFNALMNMGREYDYSNKGSDQTFLNQKIYPMVAEKGRESITQHYFKGRGNSWLNDYHTCSCWLEQPAIGHKPDCPLNITLGIPADLRETDECCQHIGSSGWNTPRAENFIHKHRFQFQDIISAERLYPNIFYWNNE